MSIPVGSKAEGGQFHGRQRELSDLWDLFESNNVLLSGPRRLGKSSILQRLADDAPSHGWHAVLIDLQGHGTAEEMLAEIDRALPEPAIKRWLETARKGAGRAADRLRKLELRLPGGLGGSIDLQAPPAAAWAPQAQRIQSRLAPQPVLILFDEFSVFLEKLISHDRAVAELLVGWLRTWRLASQVQCRFVFSGSVGLNTLLTRHHLITCFNDCYDFRLQAFSRREAIAMLEAELRGEGWPHAPDVPGHICDRVGWLSPFYVNLLLVEALRAARDRQAEAGVSGTPLTTNDVDDGYERLLAVRSRFVHWSQRLERDLAKDALTVALRVLAAVAARTDGLTRRQLVARLATVEPDPDARARRFDEVLWHLEEDGYLTTEADRVSFPSFLLRDYWQRNHGR
ncbi:ATP-binding protein [Accumulibacter sp.]|uniref:ATP-binding protein n=1 Tax=Accumulibacter sp. TaxID=2053492 RepID=UPI0026077906|nr:ATP-binding protein [Accumulibacter sp.]